MWITITLVLFYLIAPTLLIYLCRLSNFLSRLGAVVLAYVLGLLIGNVGIFPAPGSHFRELLAGRTVMPEEELLNYFQSGQIAETDLMANQIANVQDTIITIVINPEIRVIIRKENIRFIINL